MVRVAAVHDQLLFARALRAALAEHEVELVGIATTADEALRLVDELEPDILLIELALPGSLEALDALHESGSPVYVVALAPENATGARRRAVEAGVTAFIRSEADVSELMEALLVLGRLGDA